MLTGTPPRCSRPLGAPTAAAWAAALLLVARAGWSAAPPVVAAPAEFLVTSWHTENGLPDGNVTALEQTPEGYWWLGTFKGLARFDGVRFTVFEVPRRTGLPDARVAALRVDRAGRLWVGFASGHLAWLQEGQCRLVDLSALPPETPALLAPDWSKGIEHSTHSRLLRTASLVQDAQGDVWFHAGGDAVLRVKGDQASLLTPTNGLPAGNLRSLVRDSAGAIWLLTSRALYRRTDGAWTQQVELGPAPLEESALAPATGEGLILSLGRRVQRFSAGAWAGGFDLTPNAPSSQRSQVTALLEDHGGRPWLGTHWSGVLYADEAGHWHRLRREGLLAQCRVLTLFADRQGAVWVGTLGDGLHRLTPRAVTAVQLPPPAEGHLVNTVCAARDGRVWVGTDGAGAFRVTDAQVEHFGQDQGLPAGVVYSILEDRRTNLWFGTRGGLFRRTDGRFERMQGFPGRDDGVLAQFEDREGSLWFSSAPGPVRWRDGAFSLHRLRAEPATVEIRSFAQDPQGRLWVGTIEQGLFCLWSNRVERYGPAQGLTHPDARALCVDAAGGLWVGTLGGGLFRFVAGRFRAITSEDGLPDDTINGIFDDGVGHLWMSSYNGFFGSARQLLERHARGREPALVFRRLALAEGLEYRACSGAGQPVVSRTPAGRICFSNQRNLAMFDPRPPAGPQPEPNVRLEALVVDGQSCPATAPAARLAPSSARQFEFQYTALNLPRPEQAHFRYRLIGFDADWIEAGERRAGYYGQLWPGHYEFRVAAAGDDGSWYEAAPGLKLEIVPRLWERTFAQVVVSLILVGGLAATVWGVGRARLRRRLALLERQRALEQERSRIARDMHDEVGARLTQISLLSALATGNAEDAAEVRAQNDKIAGLARDVVRSLDGIVWAVRPQNDNLESLVEYLGNATRGLCEGSGVRCWFAMPPQVPGGEISANLRHNLLLACREAVNNALKHSGATELRMTIRLEHGSLVVEIADNGRGFDVPAGEARKSGLLNMRVRLVEIGGQCDFHSASPGGTRVRFTLPVGTPPAHPPSGP